MIVSTATVKAVAFAGCIWSARATGSVRGTAKTTMSSSSTMESTRKLEAGFTMMDPMIDATAADPEHLYPLGRYVTVV